MDIDSVVATAEELATRQFLGAPDDSGHWLEGVAHTGARAAFEPIVVFASLHETPADYDGTAWRLWEEAYDRFEQHRQDAVVALTARWGPPQPYSFRSEYERVLAGDESVSTLDYDLAMFTGGEPFPAWSHDGRIVGLLLGQMDKEFPIVLTLAAVATADRGDP